MDSVGLNAWYPYTSELITARDCVCVVQMVHEEVLRLSISPFVPSAMLGIEMT